MRRIKLFFKVLVKSLTSPSYYKEILKAKFSFSLKYFFFLNFLIALCWGIFFAGSLAFITPKIPEFNKKVESVARQVYPEELILIFKDGKLSSNVKEPYFIDFPSELNIQKSDEMAHFIVIDTKANLSEFYKYKSLVLLTADSAIVPDQNSTYKLIPFKDVEQDFALNKVVYEKLVDVAVPYLRYVPTLVYIAIAFCIFVMPFIVGIFLTSSRMFMLVIASLILLVVMKIMRKKISYRKILQLSMHVATLPILLGFISPLVGITFTGWMFIGIVIIFETLMLTRE